jgi:hypothetical protein
MDQAAIRRIYNACDPGEPLAPGDPRNVDVDSERFGMPRGVVWSERIAREIILSNTPVCKLFTGLPGSGKSTELRRLLQRLNDEARFLAVLIDAEERIDLSSPVSEPDIVAVVAYELERAVTEAEGKEPGPERPGFLTKLWERLASVEPSLTPKLDLGPPGAKLIFEMKSNPRFRQRVRDAISGNLTEFLADARHHVEALVERTRKAGWEGLVVVFDSLEKLRGMSTNWEDVIDSAERVFGQGAVHVRLPVHIVYTVPSALLSRQTEIEFMPAVKVLDASGRRSEPGIQALRDLVDRRIPPAEREAVFGAGERQRHLVDRIILQSGGYLRALVRTLRWCVAERELPVDDASLDSRFASESDVFRRIVSQADFEWLARVATDKYLTLADEEQRPVTDRMLANSVVLRYHDKHEWWDVHPAVVTIPGVSEAISTRTAIRAPGRDANDPARMLA